MARPGARRRTILTAACAAAVMAACGEAGDRLRTQPVLVHGLSAPVSLHVDVDGRFWIGTVGAIAVPTGGGSERAMLEVPGDVASELVAASDGALYVRSGDLLARVNRSAPAVSAQRPGFGLAPVLLDVRDRFLLQGAASGAVLGFSPDSLRPVWGWAARGAPTTALAMTLEGDILWQALAPAGTRALLLERDVQTGRILDEHRVFGRILSLASTPSGDVLSLSLDGDRILALRLRPRGDRLTPVWRSTYRLEGEAEPVVRYASAPDLLAVFRPGSESGLRVVDAEAGRVIGSVDETPLDAVFSPGGDLYVLTPREVRRVILRR